MKKIPIPLISIIIIIIVYIIALIIERYFGVWAYLDSGFLLFKGSNINVFNSLSQITYFGYDHTSMLSTRWIGYYIAHYLPTFFVYFIFFVLNFYFTYKIIANLFSHKAALLSGLFFAFNPVSLYFLNQIGFLFSYTSIVIIIYGFIEYFKYNHIKNLFFIIVGLLFLVSYTRITGIYGIFLLSLGLFHAKYIITFILANKSKCFFHSLIVIIVLTPFLFSILSGHILGEKVYFSGLSNYSVNSLKWGDNLYKIVQDSSFIKAFSLTEPVGNYMKAFQGSTFFLLSSCFLAMLIVFLSCLKKKPNKYVYFSLIILFSCIFLRFSSKFLSEAAFINLNYKFFPFLTNNTNWIQLLYIPILSFLIAASYEHSGKKIKKILTLSVIAFVFLLIYPFAFYSTNDKLGLIKKEDFSQPYQEYFFSNEHKNEASILFPNYKVYNSQSPYFLYYNYNSNNKLVLSNNPRVITKKQSEFSKNIQTNSLNIANNGVFNLKNIVIFNDNKQALKNQFDYFSTKDLSKDVNNFVNKISNDSLLKNNSNNNKILYFNTRQKNDYEYFIYSPKTILKKEVKDFFKKPIDISTRPIIIDSQSFNKPDILNDFIISEENQNIKIDYKKSALNPTKYFLKISDVDITKRFIIQLNQTFSMNWKLKWINQEEFERYQCEQEATYYPITNNSSCNIHDGYLGSLGDGKYLPLSQVKDKNHFEGNFVGNTWLIEPDDIKIGDGGKNELYALIIYEKQLWYIWCIIISIGMLALLLFITILQSITFTMKINDQK